MKNGIVVKTVKNRVIIQIEKIKIYMKNLSEYINESNKTTRLPINYELDSDIYNVLSDLAYQYELKGKDFEQKDVEKAFEWFLEKFFIEPDED